MKRFTWIFRIIGIILFIYFLQKVKFSDLEKIILNVRKDILFLCIVLTFLSVILRVLRMNVLLKRLNPDKIPFNFIHNYLIYFTGLFFGSVTPSRLGELVKVRYLKKIGKKNAFFVVVFDRLWDAFYIILFGILSLFFLGEKKLFYIFFSFLSSFSIFILFLYFSKEGLKKYIPEKINMFFDGILNIYSLKDLIIINVYTLFSMGVYFFWYIMVFRMIGINISVFYTFWVQNLTVFVTVLPISVMGIGTREAITLRYLKPLGYGVENVLSFGIIMMFFYVINIASGFLFWGVLEHIIKRRPDIYEI